MVVFALWGSTYGSLVDADSIKTRIIRVYFSRGPQVNGTETEISMKLEVEGATVLLVQYTGTGEYSFPRSADHE